MSAVQKRLGQHEERTRGFAGYHIVVDRDDDYPLESVTGVTGNY